MSLDLNLRDFATGVATNAKAMKTLINGNATDLSALTTVQKSSLVAAINEVAAAVGGAGATIDDATISALSVWSSAKTDAEIKAATAALIDAAPGALDTLNELAAALGDDPNFAATSTTALSNKAPLVHTHAAADTTSGTFAAARLPSATESATGIVELATTTEATTGTDTVRAVTPAGLKAVADTKAAATHTHSAADIASGTLAAARLPAATEAAVGAIELATSAEVIAGVDAVRAVTPAGLTASVGATNTDYVAIFQAGLV